MPWLRGVRQKSDGACIPISEFVFQSAWEERMASSKQGDHASLKQVMTDLWETDAVCFTWCSKASSWSPRAMKRMCFSTCHEAHVFFFGWCKKLKKNSGRSFFGRERAFMQGSCKGHTLCKGNSLTARFMTESALRSFQAGVLRFLTSSLREDLFS
jgi:hypothetical protein